MSSVNLTLDSILDSFTGLVMGSSESRESELQYREHTPELQHREHKPELQQREHKPELQQREHKPELPESNQQKYSNAYYGRVETITSKRSAIICFAHRNFVSLKWDENWCEPGVCLERVLLLDKNLRSSKDELEKYLEKPLAEVLEIGEPVRVSIQSSFSNAPDKCYKWFARVCWKVDLKENVKCQIPMNSLEDHMCGVVESVNSQHGIITFKTYVGTLGKAFFNRGNVILKRNKNTRTHVSLENVVNVGTEVYLVVNRWWTVGNKSDFDQLLLKNNVHYKAVQVWTKKNNEYIENGPVVTEVGNVGVKQQVRKEAVGLNGAIQGTLMSIDEDWGMIQIGDAMVTFQVCPAFLYGLQLEGIPLHRVFFSDQVVKVFMQNGKVLKLEYGSLQSGESRKRAILIYCDKNYVPSDIRQKLEILLECQT